MARGHALMTGPYSAHEGLFSAFDQWILQAELWTEMNQSVEDDARGTVAANSTGIGSSRGQ